MTRLFTLVAVGLSSLALAGAASAETFKVSFNYNPSLSVEANYDAFQRTARKACATDVKIAGGVLNKKTIEAECHARLMNDAVSTRTELSELHKMRTDQQQILATAR